MPAHPLAVALIERLRSCPSARVLEIGSGSGRNTAALIDAGFSVEAVPDRSAGEFSAAYGFDAALSTHGLLHGAPPAIAHVLDLIASALKPNAPLYATFGSTADARYGKGTRLDEDTFAPDEGDEIGVAHAFFGGRKLREMLERGFTIESMEERAVDEIVGAWAHAERPQGSVHWIVRAARRAQR